MELLGNSEKTKYPFLALRVQMLLLSLGKTTGTSPLQIWPAHTLPNEVICLCFKQQDSEKEGTSFFFFLDRRNGT